MYAIRLDVELCRDSAIDSAVATDCMVAMMISVEFAMG